MTPNRIGHDIRNLTDWLMTKSVAAHIQPYQQLTSNGILRLTAQGGLAAKTPLRGNPFGSIAEYRAFVSYEHYSALLNDGALLFLSYDFVGNELVGHSLLYYPCPIVVDDEMRSEPILDVLDLYGTDSDVIRLRSPIRFDYDPERAQDDHPPTHMHFQNEDCRMLVCAPLSVGRFVEFVFRNFYPQHWKTHEFLRSFRIPPVRHCTEDIQISNAHLRFSID